MSLESSMSGRGTSRKGQVQQQRQRLRHGKSCVSQLTRVVEVSVNERAVAEEGAHRCHVFEDAVAKGRIYEGHRLQLHVHEPGNGDELKISGDPGPPCRTNISWFFLLRLQVDLSYRSLMKRPFLCIWFSRVKLKVKSSIRSLLWTFTLEAYSSAWRCLMTSGNQTDRP